MKNDMYRSLASVYDVLNDNVDPRRHVDFVEKLIKKYGRTSIKEILDVGCGTGKITLELAARGYDLVGMDISAEMLSYARLNETKRFGKSGIVLWTEQSMTDFELYGTVDAEVSNLDCFNHLADTKELRKALGLLHNYIIPDGLLIFDVNTPCKFKTLYADRAYILEDRGVFCAWQNEYREKSGTCRFFVSVFSETEDGRYIREDGEQTEKSFSMRTLCRALCDSGFELLETMGSTEGEAATEHSLRWFFVARCVKQGSLNA